MDCFIKKIFKQEAEEDRLVHQQFQKFSKGEFPDRAMVRIKNSNGKFTISTTAEYGKDLVMNLAEKLGEDKTQVTGALVSALKLDDAGFEYIEKKSAIGVNKYLIDSEMSGTEILELCEKANKAFFGLSFSVGDDELKIKSKSPKSGKGASSKKKEGEKAKIDFCKLKTKDANLVKTLLLDDETNFKKIEIKHMFKVEDIVISDELKKGAGNDFAKIREDAQRKGKIIRNIDIDGQTLTKESEFLA